MKIFSFLIFIFFIFMSSISPVFAEESESNIVFVNNFYNVCNDAKNERLMLCELTLIGFMAGHQLGKTEVIGLSSKKTEALLFKDIEQSQNECELKQKNIELLDNLSSSDILGLFLSYLQKEELIKSKDHLFITFQKFLSEKFLCQGF